MQLYRKTFQIYIIWLHEYKFFKIVKNSKKERLKFIFDELYYNVIIAMYTDENIFLDYFLTL